MNLRFFVCIFLLGLVVAPSSGMGAAAIGEISLDASKNTPTLDKTSTLADRACARKYESNLISLFEVSQNNTGPNLSSFRVSDSNGIEVGVGKCGCGSELTAYISYFDGMKSLQLTCVDSTGRGVALSNGGKDMDVLWCDECFEPELLGQLNGTCGCPVGWTARIMNGVVYCTGEDGKVVSRQDDMELTSSLKYLSALDADDFDSNATVTLNRFQSELNGEISTINLNHTVKIDLDISKCEKVLAAANSIGSDVIAAGADASSVLKSDGKCYYRSPAGEDFAVGDQFQRACKNTANIDEQHSGRRAPASLPISPRSALGK